MLRRSVALFAAMSRSREFFGFKTSLVLLNNKNDKIYM